MTGFLSRKLFIAALALLVAITLVYVNRFTLVTWVANKGALGYLAELSDPAQQLCGIAVLRADRVEWPRIGRLFFLYSGNAGLA